MEVAQDKSPRRRDVEIFLVSTLILFLELMLIRWVGTEIRVFAYLGNLILVICFFGVGLGCYLSTRPVLLNRLGLNLLLLVAFVVNPLHSSRLDFHRATMYLNGFEDSLMFTFMLGWTWFHLVAGLIMVSVLLYLLVFIFVPMGQILGRAFDGHSHTIQAYSVNIAGSLAGVWLLNALSAASLPPQWWFAAAALLLGFLVAVRAQKEWTAVGFVAVAAFLPWIGSRSETRTLWSPYHKLQVSPLFAGPATNRVLQGHVIDVNGTYFQGMRDRSEKFLSSHRDIFDAESLEKEQFADPFWLRPAARRILVVGAGSGNNVADALRHGAEQVDGVEIDPQIYRLGKELHPEQPYDSPRVRITIEDARAFFKQATGPYDVIWFAWLDSHTLGSSYNNLRLDHYVYTLESFREAKRLLADDGIIFVNFGAEREWIGDRLFALLKEAFRHDPLAYRYNGVSGLAFVGSGKPLRPEDLPAGTRRDFVQAHQIKPARAVPPTTDDWPYLYLERARIPKLHWVASLAILGTVGLAGRRALGFNRDFDWHFFWLGAAFLLLEVQTVSRATLLFGMTWIVNAIVISAVLIMILLANLVAWRWPRLPHWLTVAGLTATITALAVVPLDSFNMLSGASKLVVASAFLTAPVFFAGLIFIRSFAACRDKSRALGSNLIGALVGGLLESLSFVTGIRALVLLVGLFYAVAISLRPSRSSDTLSTRPS